MPACTDAVYANDVYDYILRLPQEETYETPPILCTSVVNSSFSVVYVDSANAGNLENQFFDYGGMPKLYSILDTEGNPGGSVFQPISLKEAGILDVQQGALKLSGFGVLMGFIDTGIDYANPVFQNPDNTTRIVSIWDQTQTVGPPPEGLLYGTEYSRAVINLALGSDNPEDLVPTRDISGHGTALASAAAGSRLEEPYFVGAAYETELVVVKLKPAKAYLRDYYLLPDTAPAYQENDIMLAIRYCFDVARREEKPIVICLGLGNGLGDHRGNDNLSEYLNQISGFPGCFVVTAVGNEGNEGHHYAGDIREERLVEINVTNSTKGFYMELWGRLPDLVTFSLISPGGERLPFVRLLGQSTVTYGFVFEDTQVQIRSTPLEQGSGVQLVRLRFLTPAVGIWSFQMEGIIEPQTGQFDMWLPQNDFLSTPIYFLKPEPFVTILGPGYASSALTSAFYNPVSGALSPNSGRGFSASGQIKPDLAAPGVNVSSIRGPITGSGISAALCAGAVALLYQWAVAERRFPSFTSAQIKSFLLLGAIRSQTLPYPSREWGYGRLNLENSFSLLTKA